MVNEVRASLTLGFLLLLLLFFVYLKKSLKTNQFQIAMYQWSSNTVQ